MRRAGGGQRRRCGRLGYYRVRDRTVTAPCGVQWVDATPTALADMPEASSSKEDAYEEYASVIMWDPSLLYDGWDPCVVRRAFIRRQVPCTRRSSMKWNQLSPQVFFLVCLLLVPLTEFHHLPLPSAPTTACRHRDMTNGIRALLVGPDFAA